MQGLSSSVPPPTQPRSVTFPNDEEEGESGVIINNNNKKVKIPFSQSEHGTAAAAATTSHPHPVGRSMTFLKSLKEAQVIRRVQKMIQNSKNQSKSSSGSTGGGGGNNDDPSTTEEEKLLLLPGYNKEDHESQPQLVLSVWDYFMEVFLGKGFISICLLAAPFALWSVYFEWGPSWVFWLNFTVMVPLAAILGDFTEEVALHTNQTIGGLINATFGNAVEVVVAIQALMANEIRVVQASMLGSIFSNLLLVLGGCFFFGGLKYKELHFNATAATANMGLLALSGIALVLPTPFAEYYDIHNENALLISRIAALFLMFMYIQFLIFQLKTHVHIFDDDSEQSELACLPFWLAVAGLLLTTLLVTIFSEFLVDSIDGYVQESGISHTFVGIIILPIVGNAVEHVTAISVATKNKMDLAMGVAIGSCTQISLFVVPLTVLVGWATGRDMNLNFPHFEIALFVLSVFTVSIVLSNPSGNWLEGSLFMTTYFFLALGFWFEDVSEYDK